MSDRGSLLPATSFAKMAATLLLEVRRNTVLESAEAFVAAVKDDDSRRTLGLEIEHIRNHAAVTADIYKLIILLEPHEDLVLALIKHLHQLSKADRSVAA